MVLGFLVGERMEEDGGDNARVVKIEGNEEKGCDWIRLEYETAKNKGRTSVTEALTCIRLADELYEREGELTWVTSHLSLRSTSFSSTQSLRTTVCALKLQILRQRLVSMAS